MVSLSPVLLCLQKPLEGSNGQPLGLKEYIYSKSGTPLGKKQRAIYHRQLTLDSLPQLEMYGTVQRLPLTLMTKLVHKLILLGKKLDDELVSASPVDSELSEFTFLNVLKITLLSHTSTVENKTTFL